MTVMMLVKLERFNEGSWLIKIKEDTKEIEEKEKHKETEKEKEKKDEEEEKEKEEEESLDSMRCFLETLFCAPSWWKLNDCGHATEAKRPRPCPIQRCEAGRSSGGLRGGWRAALGAGAKGVAGLSKKRRDGEEKSTD